MDYRANMNPNALAAWDQLLTAWGEPLAVNSAYRSPEHNAKVGGAKHSQHMHGNAFDVSVSHMTPENRQNLARMARESGFQGIGVYDNSFHFDVGPQRAWGPSYGRDSLPDEYAWLLDAAEPPVTPSQPQSRPQAPEPPEKRVNPLQLAYKGLDANSFRMQTNPLAQPQDAYTRYL